jgi:hypothetical protein
VSTEADERGAADQRLAGAQVDPPIKFTCCKIRDVTYLTMETKEDALKAAFGTCDPDFLYGLIHQIANAATNGQRNPDENCIKFLLAFVKASHPRDEVDAALAAQMAATHVAAMRFVNGLAHAETLEERDSAERTFNKLARTFAGLVEARRRHREANDARTRETVHIEHGDVEAATGTGLKTRRQVRASAEARARRRTASRRSGAA